VNHHFGREQRRAKLIALTVALLIVAITVPLVLNADLRLRLAEVLGIVPSHPKERLFGPDASVELIVLTEVVPNPGTRPSRRMTAVYLAERAEGAVLLHDLGVTRVITLPIADYDLVAAAADRSAVLFVDHGVRPVQAVLVTVASGEVRPLPPGETDPGIPGNWGTDVYPGPPGCGAASPNGDQIACVIDSPWVLGDWELSVYPSGRADLEDVLMRANGSLPVLGWAADESALYFQNETGVWKVPLAS
jgi:hypothetical protein